MSPTDISVRSKKSVKKDPTHIALMVDSISQEDITPFDPQKIVDALISECDLSEEDAKSVAEDVGIRLAEVVKHGNHKSIDTLFIRAYVNLILVEKGFDKELKSRRELVMSHNDITQIIENSNNENGNTEHNPESINLSIAENVLRDYSLRNIFSKDVVKAHLEGKLHIHDLGMIRAYCSGNSPLYILKHGIKGIPNIMSTSKPANYAQTFARHLASMTQFLTSQFAGAIGWEGINIFFAPLCRNLSNKELKQLAQTLIYDLSQLAGAKGGQTSFTDFNLYITIPSHYKDTYAMFEGGKFGACHMEDIEAIEFFDSREEVDSWVKDQGIEDWRPCTYADFEVDAQRFLYAILDVIEEGDAVGLPFAFPKINLHVNEDTFTIDGKEENKEGVKLLERASKASAKSGCPYFIFDRNAMSIAQCCRLQVQFSESDKALVKTPEELRFVGVQNVSINLPNCALQAKGNEEKFFKELEHRMRLAMKAHQQKVKYLEHLMSVKNSPLKFYNKGMDGKPYVNLQKGSYLIGIVGLNECVYNLIGQELHESNEAHRKGLQIIIFMNKITKMISEESGWTVKLEESPAESTSARFALLDQRKYPTAFVKRNDIGIYYTNSIHFAYESNVDYIERLIKQSQYHNFIEAGAMIHLWCGEHLPSAKAIFDLIKKTWYETKCVQWVLSPEFTSCYDCEKTYNGFFDTCPKCKGTNLEQVTRIVGYMVKHSKMNKGKKAETQDRNHDMYILKE